MHTFGGLTLFIGVALGGCSPDATRNQVAGDATAPSDSAAPSDAASDVVVTQRDTARADVEARACKSQSDCYDPMQVCDPRTLTCVGKCDPNMNVYCDDPSDECHDGQCFPTCTPFAAPDGCSDTMTCVPADFTRTKGRCIAFASNGPGASCSTYDAVSDCAADARCVTFANTPTRCYEHCDPGAASWACVVDATHCSVLWSLCLHDSSNEAKLDPAALGEDCAGDERECGLTAGVTHGYCASMDGGGTSRCGKLCRTAVADDCAGQGTCHAGAVKRSGYALAGVGVCY